MCCVRPISRLVLFSICLWLLVACEFAPLTPDWPSLYAEKLGQPIVELNEAALNTPYRDRHGNLTRLTWAQLQDGSTALLGLPAHGNPIDRVVARTVVLTQDEWRRFCQEALGTEVFGWGWSAATDAVTNTFDVYASTHPLEAGQSVRIPDPAEPYCQFAFLPQGWELRIVQSQGIVAPAN